MPENRRQRLVLTMSKPKRCGIQYTKTSDLDNLPLGPILRRVKRLPSNKATDAALSCPPSMPTKYRPITQKEKVKEIGIGLLLALIFAAAVGGIAQLLFQWVIGIFDPAPTAPSDCKFSDFFDGSVGASEAYQACKDQSNSFPNRMERLSDNIPWFWIAFVVLGWAFNRNPLKGRIRNDSDDKRYDGQLGWEFLLYFIVHIMFFISIWFVLVPSIKSGIALACLLYTSPSPRDRG